MNYGKLLLGAALTASVFLATKCTPSKETLSAINPVFNGFDVPTQQFVVNGETGDRLELDNGTIISIPANCFTDKEGNVIKDDVVLDYREFHKPEDVIASGIPMEFEENGESGYLATAGMIELNGSLPNGQEVEIAAKKEISFELASYVETENVDFFDLNDETGEWTKTGTPQEKKLNSAENLKDSIAKYSQIKEPFKPKAYDSNAPVIRFEADLIDEDLSAISTAVWQYAGTDDTYNPFKYSAFKNDHYKIVRTEIIDTDLNTLEVELEFNYAVSDTIGGIKKLITWFAPVFTNKKFDEAMKTFGDKEKLFNIQMEKKRKYEEMLASSAKVSRMFEISNFGFYNCDVFMREPFTTNDFIFTINGEQYKEPCNIFLVHRTGNLKTVVDLNFAPGVTNKLTLMSTGENSLVAVFPGDEVKVFDEKTVRDLPINKTQIIELAIDDKAQVSSVKELKALL